MLAGGDVELLDDVLSQRDVRPEVAREDLREHRDRDEEKKEERQEVLPRGGEFPSGATRPRLPATGSAIYFVPPNRIFPSAVRHVIPAGVSGTRPQRYHRTRAEVAGTAVPPNGCR